jgi:malate dehydrogenase
MRDVAIIGAGEMGGALAHVLARGNAVRSIRLIDEAGRVAEGKALDITQAAPIERFATDVSGSADIGVASDASIVVIADRAKGAEWQGDDAFLLLRQLHAMASGAIVVCAGASHREIVERGTRELQMARTRIFGSAPEALRAGARALVALECGASPRDVALAVLGIPPAQIVVSWEDATVSGLSVVRLLDDATRRRLNARILSLWPPGPHALAASAAQAIETMLGRSRRLSCSFVGPDDSGGRRTRAAALPVRLDERGIAEIIMPPLGIAERVALDNAMLL